MDNNKEFEPKTTSNNHQYYAKKDLESYIIFQELMTQMTGVSV